MHPGDIARTRRVRATSPKLRRAVQVWTYSAYRAKLNSSGLLLFVDSNLVRLHVLHSIGAVYSSDARIIDVPVCVTSLKQRKRHWPLEWTSAPFLVRKIPGSQKQC